MATYYWVGGNGTWDGASTSNWSATSGGAAGAGPPLAADSVIFDANSGTGTCTTAAGAVCTGCTLNSATLGLTLGANLSPTGTFTLTAGTLTLQSYTLSCNFFSSSNLNTRTIAFGTGAIEVRGNNATVWSTATATNFSVTGSRTVNFTYSGSTGSRNINTGTTLLNSIDVNVTAGSDTVINIGNVRTLNFTGFSGTWSRNIASTHYGDLTLSSTMTLTGTASLAFIAVSGDQTITSAGKTIDGAVSFGISTSAPTIKLQDAFTIGSTRTFTLTNGTFDASNQNVSIGSFALGSSAKTLIIGNGTWTVASGWNANTNGANLTVSASTGTINMTSASAKTFAGGGKTWPTLNQGGAGALTIQQSNTFANITNTVQPATITLTSGTTQTVTDFDVSGTSGNLVTLNASTAGSQATLTDTTGTNSVSFVDIKDIAATGGAVWEAYTDNGNVDSGNNTGWLFAPVVVAADDYVYELRSFTEKRRF